MAVGLHAQFVFKDILVDNSAFYFKL